MKEKLKYLFLLMLLCIIGTSGAMATTVTARWDFTGATPIPSTLTSVNVEQRATFYPSDNDVAALYVDALNGKLLYRNSGDAQFNANTKLRVPVYSTDDVVTVTSYPNYHYFTVGGTAATQDETVHSATAAEVTQGYVEIVATATAYLYSITLQTTGTTAKYAAWNFLNEIPSTIHGTLIQNTTGTVASSVSGISLDVDASNSKFQERSSEANPDAWFTAGTILKVPVAHEGDIVTIMAYGTNYDNYTVGGIDASGSATPIFTYTATSTDVTTGYVSIVATDQSYIYAIAVKQLPTEVVPEPIDYAIDFTKPWAVALNTSGAASQCWVTSIAEGVPTYETSAPAEYLMYFKGYYKNSTYGIYYGAQFQIPVPAGSYKITLGCSDYGGDVPVTDGTTTLTTINNNGGKYADDHSNISYGYVTVNNACTLYLDAPNNNTYFPYFAIETVNDVPAQYTITYMNGESEVATSTVYEGTSLGTLPAAPSVGANQQFIGWYTALDGTGVFATTATIPTTDITYYANILDITTTNGYVVVDNSGTDGRNGESFKAAIAWANANNSYNVFVPNGTYDLGSQINSSISGATITRQMAVIGESMEGVIIKGETEGDNESINTATLKINNGISGVYLQNLTIQNYPLAYNTTNKAERAVALWDRATETVLKNVYLRGTQDVYYTNYLNGNASPAHSGQLTYYEGGKVEGTVDFICGAGTAFFEKVALHAASSATYAAANSKSSTAYIAAPATFDNENGYVFNSCTITGESDQENKYYLVRTWQRAAKTTYIDVDYSECAPNAALFKKMNDGAPETTNCHSYVTGTDDEVANYTATAVLGSTFYNAAKSTIAEYTNDVVVGETGFSSIGFPYATTLPTGVTGIAITGITKVDDKIATMTTQVVDAGSTIPANTGLVIMADPGTYTFSARPDGDAVSGNKLSATGASTKTAESDGEFYYLGVVNSTTKKVGFKAIKSGSSISKYKAYLSSEAAGGKSLTLIFDFDDTTAINGIVEQREVIVAPAYNLAGQRVTPNTKGIVIINGKKVVNE